MDKTFSTMLYKTNEEITGYAWNVSDEHMINVNQSKHHTVWITVESLLLLCILCGNTLTICAVVLSRRLARATSSQFVLNLAVSDLLVGLFLPYHMSFYWDNNQGASEIACLLKFTCMVFAFCNSLFSLICISVDRYIYIMYPLHYSTRVTKRLAWTVIGSGWIYSMIIATTPLYWNNWPAPSCELHEVLPVPFTMLVLTPNFALIWIIMFMVYWRIWREAASVRRRWGNYQGKPPDGKSIQVVLLVLGSFSICWMPFFTVLILQAFGCLRQSFSSTLYKSALALAMTNSWMNPLIYAWKNSEFLSAFSQLLHCKIPTTDPTGCGSIGQIALEGGPSH
ncbi:octopamine receptor 1 isoform X2 [Frankliniella occidentalis]|nr:octopamine receptor 1 isoform X2 [Frankliniella occidentalis]